MEAAIPRWHPALGGRITPRWSTRSRQWPICQALHRADAVSARSQSSASPRGRRPAPSARGCGAAAAAACWDARTAWRRPPRCYRGGAGTPRASAAAVSGGACRSRPALQRLSAAVAHAAVLRHLQQVLVRAQVVESDDAGVAADHRGGGHRVVGLAEPVRIGAGPVAAIGQADRKRMLGRQPVWISRNRSATVRLAAGGQRTARAAPRRGGRTATPGMPAPPRARATRRPTPARLGRPRPRNRLQHQVRHRADRCRAPPPAPPARAGGAPCDRSSSRSLIAFRSVSRSISCTFLMATAAWLATDVAISRCSASMRRSPA